MAEGKTLTQPAPLMQTTIDLSERGSASAPFVFFEQASALGCHDSILRVTLEAVRIYPAADGPGVTAERVVTAHLRMGVVAAHSLKRAIDKALLMAAPAPSLAEN